MSHPRVAFVNAPFASVCSPSIQLGLLKAECEAAGIAADNIYLNVEFAAVIGLPLYEGLNYARGAVAAEWIFGAAAFPSFRSAGLLRKHVPNFLNDLYRKPRTTWRELLKIRKHVATSFVREAAQRLSQYDVIGFSSTFQQNVASLAIAREVKLVRADVITLFGGSNFEGPMGAAYCDAFDWIDYAVSGEADDIIVPLLSDLLAKGCTAPRPGLISRDRTETQVTRLTANTPLASLPYPIYDDFFEAKAAAAPALQVPEEEICLPVETARGCWWGAKHHCTFCGLNGGGMAFREKGAVRSAEEIAHLVGRHRIRSVNAVDNIITHRDLIDFTEELVSRNLDIDLFYEVKANLKAEEIAAMARAGIRRVQPGIESMSDNVLRLMRKGTSCLQNLNMIRNCLGAGVIPTWNVLYGFPGEHLIDYTSQLRLFKRLHHLPPPHGYGRIRIDRFSPNYEDPSLREEFGGVEPAPIYRCIYPPHLDFDRAAYFFMARQPAGIRDDEFVPLSEEIELWRSMWGEAFAMDPFKFDPDEVPRLIWDERSPGTILDARCVGRPAEVILRPIEQEIYAATFHHPAGRQALRVRLANTPAALGEVELAIGNLDTLGLIAMAGQGILALATSPFGNAASHVRRETPASTTEHRRQPLETAAE